MDSHGTVNDAVPINDVGAAIKQQLWGKNIRLIFSVVVCFVVRVGIFNTLY